MVYEFLFAGGEIALRICVLQDLENWQILETTYKDLHTGSDLLSVWPMMEHSSDYHLLTW